ncbi:hypothetical protein [Sphingomonas sp. OK281]|uniref:GAP1-N1 domain-containing protein n=1 Tax=Sphingomonas sp. OK281 TaxID=1881067 RepID=UPI0008F45459|nr:hypothetical protein [Sphingomonas sp. OK281]SFO48857.1 hypothetical protein SAMN05428984_4576 [Sphingomonas sp. OK281]
MADALSTDRIKLDQTLHGYSEGHRLINGSFKVPQPDARIMLVLSDASGSGNRIPLEGYLTGYPLADSGKYVLARTWAAPEMNRPGCVWTHSLLIDFADLARLRSAGDLLDLFRRPTGAGLSGFASQLAVEVTKSPTAVPSPYLERARQWVSALYGKPKVKIVSERQGPEDDGLLVSIWMQQWPRLRRAFRFCSFSADDRSTSADTFDLQLIDTGRSSRLRIPEGVVASSDEQGEWVATLLDDLERPARSGLRQFLRDVGSDVTNGRAAMISLVHLHIALEPNAGPLRLADAVSEFERLGPGQGRMARAAVARAVLTRSGLEDRQLVNFALQQVRAERDLFGVDPAIVGRALFRWKADLLAEDLADDDPLHHAVEAALPEADADDLVKLIEAVPEAAPVVLRFRRDVIEWASFWRIASIDAIGLIRSLDVDHNQATRIVIALVEAGRDDCSMAVVDRFGIGPVVAALSRLDVAGIRSRIGWVRVIAQRTDDLAEGMADGGLWYRPLLFLLAETLDPDAVPNSIGIDPWVKAVERTRTTDDVAGEDLLAAFLFNRARGWRSRSAGRLFFLSTQRLHEAMASERLPGAAWRIVKPRLPYGSIWRDWDQCEKLRRAVVENFVDRDLPPAEFGTVVDDGTLWKELVDLAADSSRGRRYLDRVRSALRSDGGAWWAERAKLIDRKVK